LRESSALIVNSTKETFKMEQFLTLKVSWPWPCIGSLGILSCSTHWPLCEILLESNYPQKKFCLQTNGYMDQFYQADQVNESSSYWASPTICDHTHLPPDTSEGTLP